MKKILILILLPMIFFVSGCIDNEDEDETDSSDEEQEISEYEDTPDFVKDWFYREWSDQADFPDVDGDTKREMVNEVADWVADIDYQDDGTDHEYLTTGETVDEGTGGSAALAWLTFHACIANDIDNVSVEFIEWDDGSESYVCIWRFGGVVYVVDDSQIEKSTSYLDGDGELTYGFDESEYWTYE